MNIKSVIITLIFGTLFYGCGSLEMISLGEKKREITLDSINAFVAKYLPKTKKASFGTVKITGLSTLPGDKKSNNIDFMVYFNLVTFQIPEGLDGSVTYTGSLRYSPADLSLYPKDLNGTNLSFANQSIAEYVTVKDRRGFPKLLKIFF